MKQVYDGLKRETQGQSVLLKSRCPVYEPQQIWNWKICKRVNVGLKVTTDTNNNNSCMTKKHLPYNVNISYRIYLKLTEIYRIGMPDVIMLKLII